MNTAKDVGSPGNCQKFNSCWWGLWGHYRLGPVHAVKVSALTHRALIKHSFHHSCPIDRAPGQILGSQQPCVHMAQQRLGVVECEQL